jgi:hypothetical protein
MHEFTHATNHQKIVAAPVEFERELEEIWRTELRASERPFIYGTRLLSKLRMEHLLYLSFLARRTVQGVAVPDAPHLDEVAAHHFLSLITDCRFYLEYGSGGSTVVAAALNKPFISIETDWLFLRALRRKIGALTGAQRLLHANIGPIGPWGIPFPGGRPSSRRLAKWKAYPKTPWSFIRQDNYPDLVLIDGRFRVATALTCCVLLRACSDVQILVDDFEDNPHYHIIEKHARLDRMLGRMAVFRPLPGDLGLINTVIDQYSSDWR